MSLQQTLDTMSTTLKKASSLPLSSSCVVNRVDMLTLVEEARGSVPREMRAAANVLAHREQLLKEAQDSARKTLHDARANAEEMVASSLIVERAQRQAAEIIGDARDEAARLLRDADEYCERRLAAFEEDLESAVAQVRRGRERLRSRVAEADHKARLAAERPEPLLGLEPDEAAVEAVVPDDVDDVVAETVAPDPLTEEIPAVTDEIAPPPAEVEEVEGIEETTAVEDVVPEVVAEVVDEPEPEVVPEPEPEPEPELEAEPAAQGSLFEPEPVPVPLDAEDPEETTDDVPEIAVARKAEPEPEPAPTPEREEDRPMLIDLTALEERVNAATNGTNGANSANNLHDRLFPARSASTKTYRPDDVSEDDIYVPGAGRDKPRTTDEPFDQRADFVPGDESL